MTRKRLHAILETEVSDVTSRLVDFLLIALIILNIGAVMLSTVAPVYSAFRPYFRAFEVFSVAVFTIEYALRLFTCTIDARYSHPVFGRLRFAVTPLAVVDLLAILPFYLTFLDLDLRSLRILRAARIVRIAKLARYSQAMQTLGRVLVAKKEELLITLGLLVVLLILASTMMYYVERDVQPKDFSSIPAALWWGIATLSTVGYGDVVPVTFFGKILGAVVAVLGIGMFALPTGILGAGFLIEIQKRKRKPKACPHCGKPVQ